MPTRPGHWPDQLATVRIGPVWVVRPGSTWLEYCQTASATTRGAAGSIVANASSPSRALARKPWPRERDTPWPRSSRHPARVKAAARSASICRWAGQQVRFASSRRSPLATSTARRSAAGRRVDARWEAAIGGPPVEMDGTGTTILKPFGGRPCTHRSGVAKFLEIHDACGVARVACSWLVGGGGRRGPVSRGQPGRRPAGARCSAASGRPQRPETVTAFLPSSSSIHLQE